jgi:S1-C subfamily serine protease
MNVKRKLQLAAVLACAALTVPAAAQNELPTANDEWCKTPNVDAQMMNVVLQDREKLLADLLASQSLQANGGYLGIMMAEVGDADAKANKLPAGTGVRVDRVVLGSPADRAGVKNEDVILDVDGAAVNSPAELAAAIAKRQPGETVSLGVSRAGAKMKLSVTLGERQTPQIGGFNFPPGTWQIDPNLPNTFKFDFPGGLMQGPNGFYFSTRGPKLGVQLLPLSDQLRDHLGVEPGRGALVSSVVDDSAAARAGLKAGDVILTVDGKEVKGAGDVAGTLSKIDATRAVSIEIVRDRTRMTLTATIEPATPEGVE